MKNAQRIKERVQKHYTEAVEIRASGGATAGCCGATKTEEPSRTASSGCCGGGASLVQLSGYQPEELRTLPEDAVQSSFGCGNPVSFAGVERGQTVVDIGSGAGIDCLLAAQRVGPGGRVIGLDMTPTMIERAKANALTAGADNVEFRLGDAESMPIEDETADWIVSNCVINLAPDKKKVFREAYRVLKPGGRISVSDIVAELPRPFRSAELYASCLSGALPEREYLEAVSGAGFSNVAVVARHVYDVEQLAGLFGDRGWVGALLRSAARPRSRWLRAVLHRFVRNVASIQVSAVKPESARVAA
ncbi:MAG: arsenite methyltransferase [Vicinamibacteria bacterium]